MNNSSISSPESLDSWSHFIDRYECEICFDLLAFPLLTNCSHTFCGMCLYNQMTECFPLPSNSESHSSVDVCLNCVCCSSPFLSLPTASPPISSSSSSSSSSSTSIPSAVSHQLLTTLLSSCSAQLRSDSRLISKIKKFEKKIINQIHFLQKQQQQQQEQPLLKNMKIDETVSTLIETISELTDRFFQIQKWKKRRLEFLSLLHLHPSDSIPLRYIPSTSTSSPSFSSFSSSLSSIIIVNYPLFTSYYSVSLPFKTPSQLLFQLPFQLPFHLPLRPPLFPYDYFPSYFFSPYSFNFFFFFYLTKYNRKIEKIQSKIQIQTSYYFPSQFVSFQKRFQFKSTPMKLINNQQNLEDHKQQQQTQIEKKVKELNHSQLLKILIDFEKKGINQKEVEEEEEKEEIIDRKEKDKIEEEKSEEGSVENSSLSSLSCSTTDSTSSSSSLPTSTSSNLFPFLHSFPSSISITFFLSFSRSILSTPSFSINTDNSSLSFHYSLLTISLFSLMNKHLKIHSLNSKFNEYSKD